MVNLHSPELYLLTLWSVFLVVIAFLRQYCTELCIVNDSHSKNE